MSTTRGNEAVHSDDGKYHIRLGKAITEPKTKIPGSSVAVFHGTMLKLKESESVAADDGGYRMAYRPLTPISRDDGSNYGSGLEEVTLPQHDVPVDIFEKQIFEPRVPNSTSPCLQDVVAPIYEEGEEIIVKIFTVMPTSWSRATVEITALKQLTAGKCQHAPRYLFDFEKRLDGAEGGVVRYVVMTKLPGFALTESEEWKGAIIRSRVRNAFATAIKAVHACRVDNGSHVGRNILWSPEEGKCYIVDFERASFYHSPADVPLSCSDFDWWSRNC